MAGSGMEVDPPTTSSGSLVTGHHSHPLVGHPLKRSNSAPMINLLTSVCPGSPLQRHHHEHDGHCTSTTSSCTTTGTTNSVLCNHSSPGSSLFKEGPRIRRFSASYSVDLHSPTAALKTPYRLDQLKHEERIHIAEREAAHEREVQTTMQMSMSWDDLTLDEVVPPKRPGNFSEPLHIFTSPYPISSSPSPTRTVKQCFSPSLQAAVKAGTIQSRKTPSPTRKTFARRSGSPVTLRPSPLSIKRKLTGDYDDPESYLSPPKRFHPIPNSSMAERLGAVVSHPLLHCISSSSLSDSGSPEQQVPNLSMSSSAGSPAQVLGMSSSAFSFRAVRRIGEGLMGDSRVGDARMGDARMGDTRMGDTRMGDVQHNSDIREPCDMTVGNSAEDNNVTMEQRESGNHGNLLNVSMDSSPSGSFNSGTGRPTQV